MVLDPYHLHEYRYFSAGTPTKLVRDSGLESFDPPPDTPLTGSPVPATPSAGPAPDAADMRRADDADRAAPDYRRAACHTATSSHHSFRVIGLTSRGVSCCRAAVARSRISHPPGGARHSQPPAPR